MKLENGCSIVSSSGCQGKKMKKILLLTLTLNFVLFVGLTATVSKKSKDIILISKDLEVSIGRGVARQIETKFKVLDDPELTAYVDRVGEKIARICERPNLKYHFKILDDPMINAFACPGGFIYVTTGILKTIESEAELAGILGHEIGHVTARHAVKRIQGTLAYTILASLLLKDEDARKIIDVVFSLILLGYSREDEFQADRLGTRYAYQADYDPRGLRDFLATLKKLEKRKPLAIETLISSHPPTSQRIKKINDQIHGFYSLSGKKTYQTEFLKATSRLRSTAPALFQDDFSQKGNWAESRYAYYESGEYHISGGEKGYLSWHGQIFSDFTWEVKVRKIGGSNDRGYYLMFRFLDSKNTYLFGLRGDGNYSIWKVARGDAFTLQKWTSSSHLHQGNTVNYLQVRCEGSKISVYANNYHLTSVNDNAFNQGKIGFFVSSGIHVAYDDVKVYR